MYSSIHTTDFKLVAMALDREWLRNKGSQRVLLDSPALGALLQVKRESAGSSVTHTGRAGRDGRDGRDGNAGNAGNASA